MTMGITAAEFYDRRAELIKLHEENAGKRGYGREATARKIAALLGFDENSFDYWAIDKTYLSPTSDDGAMPLFPCSIKKPYARTSYLHVRRCPAGLFSPILYLKYGKSWRKESPYMTEYSLAWPPVWANNVLRTAFDVYVYDSFQEAAFTAVEEGAFWLREENANIRALIDGIDKGEGPPEGSCVTRKQLLRSFETSALMETWLHDLTPEILRIDAEYKEAGQASAEPAPQILERYVCPQVPGSHVAEVEDIDGARKYFGCGDCEIIPCHGPVPATNLPVSITESPVVITEPEPEDTESGETTLAVFVEPDGQQRLAGEDILPTDEPVKQDKDRSEARDKFSRLQAKILAEKRAIKEIKEEALAPHKDEISEKESAIELMTFVMSLYEVEAAMAEAKVKSMHEDPTYCVYAYTITGVKGVSVAVGTKQDVRDLDYKHEKAVHTEILAEFRNGEEADGE